MGYAFSFDLLNVLIIFRQILKFMHIKIVGSVIQMNNLWNVLILDILKSDYNLNWNYIVDIYSSESRFIIRCLIKNRVYDIKRKLLSQNYELRAKNIDTISVYVWQSINYKIPGGNHFDTWNHNTLLIDRPILHYDIRSWNLKIHWMNTFDILTYYHTTLNCFL